jgi:acrylyl-CoA reductase (NADPH)
MVIDAGGASARSSLQFLATVAFRSRRETGGCKRSVVLASSCASEIIERNEFAAPAKTLAKGALRGCCRFRRLDRAYQRARTTRHGGAVAACGLAGGMDLPISVAPFILCGASLFGIESVIICDCRLANGEGTAGERLDREKLAAMTSEIGLAEVIEAARGIVEGPVRGRIVVKIG